MTITMSTAEQEQLRCPGCRDTVLCEPPTGYRPPTNPH